MKLQAERIESEIHPRYLSHFQDRYNKIVYDAYKECYRQLINKIMDRDQISEDEAIFILSYYYEIHFEIDESPYLHDDPFLSIVAIPKKEI